MSGILKYYYFSTIFGGNIGDDNIIHPSESCNFIPKAYREFSKKNENKGFFTFSRGGNLKYFLPREKKMQRSLTIFGTPIRKLGY
jgi:hypothetical protein